jgi:cysteine synthase A
VSIFHMQKLDWIKEATRDRRNQWHNLKYYTWVEQQGKTVEELNAQKDLAYWLEQQDRVAEVDEKIRAFRGS